MRYPSCYVLVTDLDDSTSEIFHKNHNPHQMPHKPQQPQQQSMLLNVLIDFTISIFYICYEIL